MASIILSSFWTSELPTCLTMVGSARCHIKSLKKPQQLLEFCDLIDFSYITDKLWAKHNQGKIETRTPDAVALCDG